MRSRSLGQIWRAATEWLAHFLCAGHFACHLIVFAFASGMAPSEFNERAFENLHLSLGGGAGAVSLSEEH